MRKALIAIGLAILAVPIGYNVATSYVGDEDLWRLARCREMSFTDALLQSNIHVPGWKHFRPAQYATFFLLVRLFGRQAWLYHLSFFSIHILSAVSLYLLARRLTRNRACALVAGTLLAFHQANSEILCVLASFHYIQLVFFSLLSLLFLARHLERDRRSDLALSVLFFALGLLSDGPGVILIVFVIALAEFFFSAKLTAPRRGALYSAYAATLLAFLILRRSLVEAPLVGTGHIASAPFIIRNCLMIVRNVFLPYDTMCHPPYETLFFTLCILLGYAYAASCLLFIRAGGLRSRIFLFASLCFSLYVVSVSNFFGHERVCSLALPFYALLVASLFAAEYGRVGRLYRFVTIALYALLIMNNYPSCF